MLTEFFNSSIFFISDFYQINRKFLLAVNIMQNFIGMRFAVMFTESQLLRQTIEFETAK